MNVVKEIQRINEKESRLDLNSTDSSWHARYKDSAYVFCGGLDYGLTEGDIITVFSQYGEIVDINLVRDKSTGKSKGIHHLMLINWLGYAFICYEDQRSTILAVDNFNGIKLCGRTLRVDHVANYKHKKEDEEEMKKMEERQKERKELSEKEKRKLEKKAKKLEKEQEKLEKEREKEARKLEKIKSQADADLQKIAEGYQKLEVANNPYSEMNMNGKYALFNHFKDKDNQEEKEGETESRKEEAPGIKRKALADMDERELEDRSIEIDSSGTKKLKFAGKLSWDKTGKISKVKVPLNPVAALAAQSAATASTGGPSDAITTAQMDALRASLGLKPLKQ